MFFSISGFRDYYVFELFQATSTFKHPSHAALVGRNLYEKVLLFALELRFDCISIRNLFLRCNIIICFANSFGNFFAYEMVVFYLYGFGAALMIMEIDTMLKGFAHCLLLMRGT